jgi:MFS family permease
MNDLNQTSLLYTLHLDGDQMSWVGSLLNIGALFGALCGGLLMDKFGRRFVLMTMTSPYIIGWLMITLALDPSKLLFIKTIYFSKFNLYFSLSSVMLYVGRVIVGFAGGVCAAIAPCYIGTSVSYGSGSQALNYLPDVLQVRSQLLPCEEPQAYSIQ